MESRRFHLVSTVLALAGFLVPLIFSPLLDAPRAATSSGVVEPSITVQASTPARISMTFRLPDVELRSVSEHGVTFDRVVVRGADSNARSGEPDLPVIRRLVALPDAADYSLDVRVVEEKVHREVDVAPATIWRDGQPIGLSEKGPVYEADAYHPARVALLGSPESMRGQKLARLEIHPARYNPVTRELRVAQEIELVVTADAPTTEVVQDVGPFQNVLRSIAVNAADSNPVVGTFGSGEPHRLETTGVICWATSPTPAEAIADLVSCQLDYLIIMGDELNESLVSQLALRRATFNGFNVGIVKMSQITSVPGSPTSADVRAAIKGVYDSASATHMSDGRLGYVLLLGDAYDPSGNVLIPHNYADKFYADLDDPADGLRDVFLGRIPVDANDGDWELNNIVTKILDYDPASAAQKEILLTEGWPVGFGEPYFDAVAALAGPRAEVTQLIRDRENYNGATTAADQAFSQNVADTISSLNPWIFGLYGHGFYTYSGYAFFPRAYDLVTNTTLPFLLFNISSYTGFFMNQGNACVQHTNSDDIYQTYSPEDRLDDCDVMTERLILQPNGAIGAVSFYESAGGPNNIGRYGYYQAIFEDNAYSLGEIHLAASLRMAATAEFRVALLGDPAVNILWDEGSSDSIDLAILGPESFAIPGALDPKIADSGSGVPLEVTVTNTAKTAASNVTVSLWDDHPDSTGATLLDSVVLPTVPPFYGTGVASFSLGALGAGPHSFWAQVEVIPGELNPENQIAKHTIWAYDQQNGFPISMVAKPILADVHPSPGVELLSSNRCVSSNGIDLWEATEGVSKFAADVDKNGTIDPIQYSGPDPLRILQIDGETGLTAGTLIETTEHLDLVVETITDFVTDDDFLEILCMTGQRTLLAYSGYDAGGESNLLWQYGFGPDTYIRGLAVGDVDVDGNKDIVLSLLELASPSEITLELVRLSVPNSPTGVPTLVWAHEGSLSLQSQPVLVPSETPGSVGLDIVIADLGATQWELQRFDATGTMVNAAALPTNPVTCSAGDTDGDGLAELVCLSTNSLSVVDGDGSVLHSVSTQNLALSFLPLVDVDGDGASEIVTVSRSYGLFPGDMAIEVRGPDLMVDTAIELPADPRAGSLNAPSVGDLDLDGDVEILLVDTEGNLQVVDLVGSAGRFHWPQPAKYPTGAYTYEQPIAGFINNDASFDGDVRLVYSASNLVLGEMFVSAGTSIRAEENASLIVYEDLRMIGGASAPITVKRAASNAWNEIQAGTGGTQSELQWVQMTGGGTMFRANQPTLVTSCSFDNGVVGIQPYDAIDVQGATFTNLSFAGILLDGTGSDANIAAAAFSGVPAAIAAYRFGTPTLTAEISGNYDVGIQLNRDGTNVVNSQLSGSSGLGIEIVAGIDASISNTTIADHDGGGVLCQGCDSTTELLDVDVSGGSTFGIKAVGTVGVTIESCEITDNANDGIWCDNASVYITSCLLQGNALGIRCDNGSDPIIGQCGILSNGGGVLATGESYPIVGKIVGGGTTGGFNQIVDNGGPSNGVVNLNPYQILPVYAQNNWWGVPRCPKILLGNIICDPALTEPPASSWLRTPPEDAVDGNDVPRVFSLGNPYPNPFNPQTVVPFQVPAPGGEVSVVIYDVRGRRVRELLNRRVEAGRHTWIWDGRTESGQRAASGVYLVKMVAPGYTASKKLMMLK